MKMNKILFIPLIIFFMFSCAAIQSQNLQDMSVEDRMFFELEAAAETVNDITAAVKVSDMDKDKKETFYTNINYFWSLYEVAVHARSAYIQGDVDAEYALQKLEEALRQKYGLEDMYE